MCRVTWQAFTVGPWFEAGSDVVTRCVQRINWNNYKIDKANDKVGIFVSIVSTKIPFKVRPGRQQHRSPDHQTRAEPSFCEMNGIL